MPDGSDAGMTEEVFVEFATVYMLGGMRWEVRCEREVSLAIEMVEWTISFSEGVGMMDCALNELDGFFYCYFHFVSHCEVCGDRSYC